jgi:hypothetical protein
MNFLPRHARPVGVISLCGGYRGNPIPIAGDASMLEFAVPATGARGKRGADARAVNALPAIAGEQSAIQGGEPAPRPPRHPRDGCPGLENGMLVNEPTGSGFNSDDCRPC